MVGVLQSLCKVTFVRPSRCLQYVFSVHSYQSPTRQVAQFQVIVDSNNERAIRSDFLHHDPKPFKCITTLRPHVVEVLSDLQHHTWVDFRAWTVWIAFLEHHLLAV